MTNQHHDDRPQHLHHHFDTEQQQFDSDKLGMWLFLVTEILLFGGLFVAYAYYRAHHPEVFLYAHKYLDKTLGGINTVVLIASSLTMAWAVRAAQLGQRRLLIILLSLTLLAGFAFLGIKAVEYEHKWKHGLLWGQRFQPEHHEVTDAHQPEPAAEDGAHHAGDRPADQAEVGPVDAEPCSTAGGHDLGGTQLPPTAPGPGGLARLPGETPAVAGEHVVPQPENVHLFFGVYFAMTGLHALHVIAGMIAIFVMVLLAAKGRFGGGYFTPVDLTGLYWHVVDLIWIFLFPLLYLIH